MNFTLVQAGATRPLAVLPAGADSDGLVFVRNASSGVASVIRSIEPALEAGDELLTTAQDYNAVRQMLEYSAERHEAKVVVAEVPFPVEAPNQGTKAVLSKAGPRTTDRYGGPHWRQALDEVTAILGKVEPFVASDDRFHVGRKSDTEHSRIGPLAMCSPMYQALAKTLDYLTDAPDTAAWLAFVQRNPETAITGEE